MQIGRRRAGGKGHSNTTSWLNWPLSLLVPKRPPSNSHRPDTFLATSNKSHFYFGLYSIDWNGFFLNFFSFPFLWRFNKQTANPQSSLPFPSPPRPAASCPRATPMSWPSHARSRTHVMECLGTTIWNNSSCHLKCPNQSNSERKAPRVGTWYSTWGLLCRKSRIYFWELFPHEIFNVLTLEQENLWFFGIL